MKSILLILICLAQFSPAIYAQQLIIKGKIRCLNTAANSTKGAEGVVVVPAFVPARSTITANNPSGFFEIKTGYGIEKLRDKTISLHAISRCSSCRESVYRVFISEDQDRMHRQDDKSYVT
ncbi:MAG TPA: hypothetical protein PLP34_05950, partial [Chitinophagaceae bacterium]|nr:hypothetical protein [Chitinophagaceae bacterium]